MKKKCLTSLKREEMPNEPKNLVGPEIVAETLNVSLSWILSHSLPSAKYRLPSYQIGGLHRYDLSEVLDWAKKNKRGGNG